MSMQAAKKYASELQNRAGAGARRSPLQNQTDLNKVDMPVACYWCWKHGHKSAQSPLRSAHCHNIGNVAHMARVCKGKQTFRGRRRRENPPRNQVKCVEKKIKDLFEHSHVFNKVLSDPRGPILVEVELENQQHHMKLDTGTAVSLIFEQTYRTMFQNTPLQEMKTTLKPYSGEPL